MQTPEERAPNVSWGQPARDSAKAAVTPPVFTLPPPLRAFTRDDLTRALLILMAVSVVGLIVLNGVVAHLAPLGVPAAGLPSTAAHVYPAFADVPSRVQTNGNPLTVTLRGTQTRADPGFSATRYLFLADPPNDPPMTLCDGEASVCQLLLGGAARQSGTWIITLRVYDNAGGMAETRTRLRVS